jgi:serine/alanine adding enzyme
MAPRDGAAWDRFVEADPLGTFCHLSAWWPLMEEVLGHRVEPWVARAPDGSLAGVLPIVEMKSVLFGHSRISMPFLNYGGALGSPEARQALSAAVIERAKRAGADRLVLRDRVAPSARKPESNGAPRKVTVLLDLPDRAETLWSSLDSKVRSQIRRPMKEGMEARFGAEEAPAFYRVFARNMRDLGTPVLPPALFEGLPGAFGNRCVFGTVRHSGQVVAAGCGFRFRDEFEMTWASSLREHNRLAPNMLLYWRFMEKMVGDSVRVFNFGRCTPDGGTHRFKKQWGGRDLPLPWQQWPPVADASGPQADRGAYALASSLWRRLPVPVANLLGPPIARRLPTF